MECGAKANITKATISGTMIMLQMLCDNKCITSWDSQPLVGKTNRIGEMNLILASATLFTGNTFQRVHEIFKFSGIHLFSKSTFYRYQNQYLFGVINQTWNRMQQSILKQIQNSVIRLIGDGRCDSPGHSAKYLSYEFALEGTDKILSLSLVHVSEAGSSKSNGMEIIGFKRALRELEEKGVTIKKITTDRHK